MSTEISTQSAADVLAVLSQANEGAPDSKALAAVTSSGYLPYVQLFGGNSKEVKRGEIKPGTFAIVQDKRRIELGSTFSFLAIAWRPKAMQYSPDVLAYYDPQSDEFKRIQAAADQQNSNKGFGPECLIWVPSVEKFATFFFGNKSARRESPSLLAIINGPQGASRNATVTAKFIEYAKAGKEYSWHAPSITPCDTPLAPLPTVEDLQTQITNFRNPPKQAQVEKDDSGSDERG